MQSRGALIILEGCDRVGKSTQAKLLLENLIKQGKTVELMNFPDRSSAIGGILNQYLKKDQDLDDHAVHLLFSANRWEAAKNMEKLLNIGTTLIIDRYSDSGVAFSAAKGLDLSWCRSSDTGLPRPDLVLYLTLSDEQSQTRGGYGQERYEKTQFQTVVKDTYSKLVQDYWKIVSAENRSIEELQSELLQHCSGAITAASTAPLGKLYMPAPVTASAADGQHTAANGGKQ